MNSLPLQAILGGVAAVLSVLVVTGAASLPVMAAFVSAVLACVALMAQARRLRDEQRLVYRPVYARRQGVQRRVSSDD